MDNTIANLIKQLSSVGNGPVPADAQDEFHRVAQSTPPDVLSRGVVDAFNSDRTPPFGEMVGHLFGNANPQQRAGILGTLLGGMRGANVPASVQQAADGSVEHAANVSTDDVQQIASQAQNDNSGVVDQMGRFYAQHPVLVKSLGAAAMAIVLGRIHGSTR